MKWIFLERRGSGKQNTRKIDHLANGKPPLNEVANSIVHL